MDRSKTKGPSRRAQGRNTSAGDPASHVASQAAPPSATLTDVENAVFQRQKFEATGLEVKERAGTITPAEQERLGVLQAQMDGLLAERLESAQALPNLLERPGLFSSPEAALRSETSRVAVQLRTQDAGSAPGSTLAAIEDRLTADLSSEQGVIQRGGKTDAVAAKADTPDSVTNQEIKEAVVETVTEILSDLDYRDADKNKVLSPTFVLLSGTEDGDGMDYAAFSGGITLPTKAEVCADIKSGNFKMYLRHEVGHAVRTIKEANERESFPLVERVLDTIDFAELIKDNPATGAKADDWKEEVRSDLKAIQFQYNEDETLPTKSDIEKYGEGLGTVVDATHPPAAERVKAMKEYVRRLSSTKSCCYITTACVRAKGLPDDCEALTVLRDFRDRFLATKSNGPALIDLYYMHSGAIVDAIAASDDAAEVFEELYGVIMTCVEAIQQGDDETAYDIYCQKVVELKDRFAPEQDLFWPGGAKVDEPIGHLVHPETAPPPPAPQIPPVIYPKPKWLEEEEETALETPVPSAGDGSSP